VITLTFYTCPLLRIDARGASTPPRVIVKEYRNVLMSADSCGCPINGISTWPTLCFTASHQWPATTRWTITVWTDSCEIRSCDEDWSNTDC